MPGLNIAARLGRQRERVRERDRVSHMLCYRKDAFTPKSAFLVRTQCVVMLVPNNGESETFMWFFVVLFHSFHALIQLLTCIFSEKLMSLSVRILLHPSRHLSLSAFALVSGLPVFFHLALSAFIAVFF